MSKDGITARLRLACELGRLQPRGSKVPMDAASVTARLRSVSELWALCMKLQALGTPGVD